MKEFIQYIPEYLLKESGKVFYSGRNAFTGKKKIYVLGLNPGGDSKETVERHNDYVLKKNPNWSAYLNAPWRENKSMEAGSDYRQKRMIYLFNQLNQDPFQVPSSNIIFLRSKGYEDIKDEFPQLAKECWEFHQKVINSLGIKVIICLGKKAGKFVKSQLKANKEIGMFVEKYPKRPKKSIAYENEDGFLVIRIPHPSRAKWDSKEADPTPFIKKILQERNII